MYDSCNEIFDQLKLFILDENDLPEADKRRLISWLNFASFQVQCAASYDEQYCKVYADNLSDAHLNFISQSLPVFGFTVRSEPTLSSGRNIFLSW